MIRTVVLLAGALLCVLTIHAADARPRHHRTSLQKMQIAPGCSEPFMWLCNSVSAKFAHTQRAEKANKKRVRMIPPGLARVMAEGAGRAIGRRPRAWCGWFMRRELGVANPAGNLARWWAGFGRPAHGPHVGAIVVWRHHVGKITGRTTDGRWIVKSGNDGHRVRERPRSVANAIAFRWPV